MKTILTLLLTFFIVGMAGAVTIVDPTVNFGAYAGFANPGVIKASDLYATDDLKVGDDAQVLGDLAVTGAISAGTGTISSGVYDGDFRLAANHSFYSTTGSGGIDWSNATGTWKMPTGAGTIAGTTDFNGAITSRNITLDANYNLVTSGTGTITSASTITGEQITSTDDMNVTDTLYVADIIQSNDAGLTNVDVSGTLDVEGATTTAAITVDSGSIITADQYKRRTVTNATNFTITDGGADVYLVGNGTGVNTQTVTFPTAAANKGRIITVILATDPLSNSVILDGEGSEQIDGANTKTTTDAVGSMYHLICNGVGWIKIVSSGTWS